MSRVSLIVPTLNAEYELPALLDAVMAQTRVPDEILIVDSSSDDDTVGIAESYPGVQTLVIQRSEFDHGGTRRMAFDRVKGDYVLFLTQDSVPADNNYVDYILAPFDDPEVAMVTGRQVPKANARRYVQLVQEYNYPPVSNTRTKDDIPRLGIKAFFSSDACSAYRRLAYESVGGFQYPCRTNEDMLMCARFLRANYKFAYEAKACVSHSHNLSIKEQFCRNRIIGTFLKQYADELNVPSEVNEGISLVKTVSHRLIKEKNYVELCRFAADCIARLSGNIIGKLG